MKLYFLKRVQSEFFPPQTGEKIYLKITCTSFPPSHPPSYVLSLQVFPCSHSVSLKLMAPFSLIIVTHAYIDIGVYII